MLPGIDEQLLDPGQGLARRLAKRIDFDRHRAPAGDCQTLALQFDLQTAALGCRPLVIPTQKDLADGEGFAELNTLRRGDAPQEVGRQGQQQAATVAGLAVGGDRAAMGQPLQRTDRICNRGMVSLPVEPGDQPEATGITFEFGTMQRFQRPYSCVWSAV